MLACDVSCKNKNYLVLWHIYKNVHWTIKKFNCPNYFFPFLIEGLSNKF